MELLLVFGPLLTILIIYYIDIRRDLKFQNEILDLDIEKQYSLNDIKSIFLDTYQFRMNIDELDEYNIKRIIRLIEQIQGNLLKKETKYYEPFLFNTILRLFKKQKTYNNDKEKLSSLLSTILNELSEEKKFFGLNTREREILKSLSKNVNLSEVDKRSISELKDIVTNRYQELLKRNEQSNKLSKISIYLGGIGLIIALIGFFK
ncbi:hypothetical protein ACN9JZ_03530 [Aliarcobacter butzleri]|uniref:hypothetical protein n=1 Tax=Aliarcobacter butzleri TaxID=28197 RepID=UPI003AF441C5